MQTESNDQNLQTKITPPLVSDRSAPATSSLGARFAAAIQEVLLADGSVREAAAACIVLLEDERRAIKRAAKMGEWDKVERTMDAWKQVWK